MAKNNYITGGPALIKSHAQPISTEIIYHQYLNIMANYVIDDKKERL